MKKWMIMFSLFTVMFLVACGNTENGADSNGNEEAVPAAIEATIFIPSEIESKDEITLAVSVTQGDKPVEDADEVKFEVWEDGKKDDSVLVEAKHEQDGKYVAPYTFEKDAVFHIQSHVTARSMHTMPKEEIAIGSDQKVEHHQDSGEHDHGGDVAIHISPKTDILSNEETAFDIHITEEEQGLEKADVRLEIIQLNDEHEVAWIDALERADGTYTATHLFAAEGEYRIVVHVENAEGLHEHMEQEITVQ